MFFGGGGPGDKKITIIGEVTDGSKGAESTSKGELKVSELTMREFDTFVSKSYQGRTREVGIQTTRVI